MGNPSGAPGYLYRRLTRVTPWTGQRLSTVQRMMPDDSTPTRRRLLTLRREVFAIDTSSGHLTARIPVGERPHGPCLNPQPGTYSLGHPGIFR